MQAFSEQKLLVLQFNFYYYLLRWAMSSDSTGDKVCPSCNGSGYEEDIEEWNRRQHQYFPNPVPCGACGGGGLEKDILLL